MGERDVENSHLLPRSVLDLTCPHGHVITEPQDRRWLWHIEGVMAVSATNDGQRAMVRTLRRYLSDTCEHHWHDDPTGYGGIAPPYRQCLWCSVVEPLGDVSTPPATPNAEEESRGD